MWVKKYWFPLLFFCFLSTNCFSVVPLQLKYSAAHLYSWHYRWRSCASVFVSLSYLYYCCCIILSRIALYCWQDNSYLGVIHLLYYLKWSSGTKSPTVFSLLDLLPNHVSSTIYTRCLRLITWQNLTVLPFLSYNHQLNRYCLVHVCMCAWLYFFKQFSNSFFLQAWPFFPLFLCY